MRNTHSEGEGLKLIFGVLAELSHGVHPAITRFAGVSLSGRGRLDEQVSPPFFHQGNEFKVSFIHQRARVVHLVCCSADVDGAHHDGSFRTRTTTALFGGL